MYINCLCEEKVLRTFFILNAVIYRHLISFTEKLTASLKIMLYYTNNINIYIFFMLFTYTVHESYDS